MSRASKRTAATQGPDALDWFGAAHDAEKEFLCRVVMRCGAALEGEGKIEVMALRVIGGQHLMLAREEIAYPNTRMQSFWPSAYLLLHRVRRTLANYAYAPPGED